MKEIVFIYKKSVDKNLKDISSILKERGINNPEAFLSCKKILKLSSDNTVNKWLSGRKYARTAFAKEAFGKYYPKKYIEISLSIDAMINILDDLFDEKISDQEKSLYILELLRVYSLYSSKNPKSKIQIAFGHYMNKLISLAVSEKVYQKMIAQENNLDKIIDYSLQIFLCRSMDIDIFNEVALTDFKNNKESKRIKDMGRVFRAVNIFKKDIRDIDYDRERGIESVVLLMRFREGYNFFDYVNRFLDKIIDKADIIKKSAKSFHQKYKAPIENYYKMIQGDKKEIIKILNN